MTTQTIGPLHFEDLEPGRFEEMCMILIGRLRGTNKIDRFGASGTDKGIDIRCSEKKDGTEFISHFQCKRYKTITPGELELIAENYCQLHGKERPDLYCVICGCRVSATAIERFEKKCHELGFRDVEIWSSDKLEMLLIDNHDVLNMYFGINLDRQQKRHLDIRIEAVPYGDNHNLSINDLDIGFKVNDVYMKDVPEGGIVYEDEYKRKKHKTAEEVRINRHLYKNGFALKFIIKNEGSLCATGLRIEFEFPIELVDISMNNMREYWYPEYFGMPKNPKKAKEWKRRFMEPDEQKETQTHEKTEKKIYSRYELMANSEVKELVESVFSNEVGIISDGYMKYDIDEVRNFSATYLDPVYIIPTKHGNHQIKINYICNEMLEPEEQVVNLVVG